MPTNNCSINSPLSLKRVKTGVAEVPEKRPKLSPANNFHEFIRVMVGNKSQKFLIPKSLLVFTSGYFEAACRENSGCSDGAVIEVCLAHVDPKIFGIYVTWLYMTNLTASDDFVKFPKAEADAPNLQPQLRRALFYRLEAQREQLVECYCLGDFLQAPKFQNATMNLLIENGSRDAAHRERIREPLMVDIKSVYRNTKAGSPLRALTVDAVIYSHGARNQLKPDILEFWQDLGKKAMDLLANKALPSNPFLMDPCTFHIHPDKRDGFQCPEKRTCM
ncbi:hypothetical protein BP6252_03901 [Coleophoma cylindrospora]|uniref:BTB domain-containing protein n=1 Tax=Coleophoma cylindrospora TaxID=1849047 RepID=A0A3D8S8W3_9HELO|nr:hypothetical protein BP6252_03901 [Coleophoma cylindrospora]